MRIALHIGFRASKKEPLAVLLERIHQAVLTAGLGEPVVEFSFSDAPVPGFVSSVERILKRYPELGRFQTNASLLPGALPIRQITNAVDPSARSRHNRHGLVVSERAPALRVADPSAKKLPAPAGPLAIVLEACGKAAKTLQAPLIGASIKEPQPQPAAPSSKVKEAIAAIVRDYRARLTEIIDRAALPHDLPPALEALTATPPGENTGPKKPVLDRAFKPMGYDCRGGSGTFTLRRRTPGNLAVQINLDVGTWSNKIMGFFRVQGVGFTARLPLPVSKRATTSIPYPIGNAERWQKIVENLAALVAEFARSSPRSKRQPAPRPHGFDPTAESHCFVGARRRGAPVSLLDRRSTLKGWVTGGHTGNGRGCARSSRARSPATRRRRSRAYRAAPRR